MTSTEMIQFIILFPIFGIIFLTLIFGILFFGIYMIQRTERFIITKYPKECEAFRKGVLEENLPVR